MALSWVGTGRLIFSLNYGEADFAAVEGPLCRRVPGDAAGRLVVDQWQDRHQPVAQKRQVLRELVAAALIADGGRSKMTAAQRLSSGRFMVP